MDLCEFNATLGYIRLIQSQTEQSQELASDTFNPSTWESHNFNPHISEVETGKDMNGWTEEYKVGGNRVYLIQSFS